MSFESAEKIAAAVLYEGYMLYPYRPSAIKNRQRWNFGTLSPRGYAEGPSGLVAECLVVGEAALDVRIKFLQLVRRDPSLAWDEAVERTSDHNGLHVPELVTSPLLLQLQMPTAEFAETEAEPQIPPLRFAPVGMTKGRVASRGVGAASRSFSALLAAGKAAARDDNCEGAYHLGSSYWGTWSPSPLSSRPERSGGASPQGTEGSAVPLTVQLMFGAEKVGQETYKLRLSVQNVTSLSGVATRDDILPLSLISAHLLLRVTSGEFVSLLDPGDQYRDAVAACCSSGVFPVLVGVEPDRSMMLCSPIILYDYPRIAPESAGDFFDGTEMDEMLALRVLTLTDAEKQEMRRCDPRARRILERTEALTPAALLKTHGRCEAWNPFADAKAPPESVRISGVDVRTGDRVRLCPQKHADIFDMALNGKIAVIEAIEQDFEDQVQLAVVLDDDPGREFGMMRQPGHRFFFSPQEVEPA